jgi:adenylyltransferase/sulfurtransferase
MLNPEEIAHYDRHLMMPEIGLEGQLKLKASSVLVIGAGGLGCPVLHYLTSMSFRRVTFSDKYCTVIQALVNSRWKQQRNGFQT